MREEIIKQRAQRIVRRQQLFSRFREYVYGVLFCLMAVFGFMLESDGRTELLIGIVGMFLTVLVALGVRYVEDEIE